MAKVGRGMSLEDRFWAKVDKGGPDECWLWTGALSRGYGNLVIGHSGNRYAHRVAWELMVGPIPERMHLDHRCREKRCVNPDHLRVVTNKQNMEHRGNSDRGVSFVRPGLQKPWRATVMHNYKQHTAGYFATREEAAQAAAALRRKLFTHNDEDRG